MRSLYLGLNPKEGMTHYPVIQTRYLGNIDQALVFWPEFTHVIFTSQTTVGYWPGPWDKQTIAIGPATASALRKKGLTPLIATDATQEGIMALIKNLKGFFFLPHSSLARVALVEFMQASHIAYFALPLYETYFQALKPIPNLDDFDEIVFTSPSTVEGFLRIYGALPRDKTLTAIGPITEKALCTANLSEYLYRSCAVDAIGISGKVCKRLKD